MPSPCLLLLAALCCSIFMGAAKSNMTEEQLHRQLDDEPKTYAMWGDSPWGAENQVVAFDLKTGEAGQVVLGSGGYFAPVAPAVDPATKTLYLPIVEIGPIPGFPFGEPKLVVVNATTEPWTIIRSISLGPRDILIMEYAFFDPVHQRVWVLVMRVDKSTAQPGSEYLWSVDPATNIYEKIELSSFLPPYTIGVTSAVFNPATRRFVLSIILHLGNETTYCSSKGACVPAIAMFDIDRRALSNLTANKEMAATALVWDSNNQEIYSFLTPGDSNYPPPYYGRVDAQTGVITLLRKFDDSLFGMVVWGNPLFDPRTGSVIAPLVWYNQASPLNMTFVEPTTGLIKHSFTFTNPGLDQMFIL